ncbi:centromere protein W [Bombina bombina]|uniref:centromere protein W n=1 Tax=Bombina bombina TaxID=8345 RepID=UPI00235A8155|nr:centromere protein W [Bombina bombina]
MKRSAPRGVIKSIIKKHKPELRLETNIDLLVHLNCLLFINRLAKEARLKSIEDKSPIIKPVHLRSVAKIILKKSKG